MLARCLSASLHGLEAKPVTVDVGLAPGLPGIQLVGLPDKAIQESRERVRSALRNSGFRGPLVRPFRGGIALADGHATGWPAPSST
jgi:magnesium chelatase family protein